MNFEMFNIAATAVHTETSALVPPPPFQASSFPPRFMTDLWFFIPFGNIEKYISTEATEPYLCNTLNKTHIILNDH